MWGRIVAKARSFGATWWGRAWLDALEQRALADPNRLPRGRTYARQERVTEVELSPGLLRARVWGTDRYTAQLSIRELTDAEWDRVLDVIMGQASNAAALLAGEVPQAIGDLVLPDRGDLGPDCSCPDWAEPCKHVAALCYTAADLLDEDPFALLALRGRGRDDVLAEVRERRSHALGGTTVAASQLPRGADPGVSASKAYRAEPVAATRAAIVPATPANSYRLGSAAPVDAGIDHRDLTALVLDAADRAWRMLAEGATSGLQAPAAEDVVRRAARSTPAEIDTIAATTGLKPPDLTVAAAAWRVGGQRGYRASRDRWDPTKAELRQGVEALGGDIDDPGAGGVKVRANRVSLGRVQLRLDPHGLWWRLDTDERLGWVITAGPAIDPTDLT